MDKSHLPLKTALEHYLTACRTEGKTPKTLFDYRHKLQRFVDWQGGTLGEFDLASARESVAHLQSSKKWQDHPGIETSEDTLSPQTVAGHVRTLKGFATWLFEEEYLPENRLRRLAKPKVPSRVVEVLRDDEVRRLLAVVDERSANGARDLAILVLFLDTGLRLSELVGLAAADVHLDDGWLKVFGKGGKERMVPFGSRAAKVLSRYISFFRPEDAAVDALFVNADGSPITANTVKMLFSRLLSNAIKYTDAGGTVDVFCDVADGYLRITVADTGRGIAEDMLPRLFSPFDRIGNEFSGVEGTGLDLALSKYLVEGMGGCISVESTPGIGSMFRVELQFAPDVSATRVADPGHTQVAGPPIASPMP